MEKLTGISTQLVRDFPLLQAPRATAYAQYSTFSIGDNSTEYTLSIGGYSGTVGNSLNSHNGMKFTTYDNDNVLIKLIILKAQFMYV